MKTYAILIAAVMLTFSLSAQTSSLDQIFNSYSDKETATTISLSGSMFKMFANLDPDESASEFGKLAEKIQSIRVVIDAGADDLSAVLKAVSSAATHAYEPLMQVNSKDDFMEMYISEKDGEAKELFITASGDQNLVLVSVKGSIPMEDVSKVSEKVIKSVAGNRSKSN